MAKKAITVLSVQELQIIRNVKSMHRKIRDSEIDFSDIPEMTKEQLSQFKRRGRPVLGAFPRRAISIRIDQSVLDKLRAKAKKTGIAYQSLINDILKKAV